MSGICGIFNLDGRPADPELIQRMTAAIAHRGPDGIHHVIDGPVALGHCMLCTTPESLHETQPLWDETKQYCLTLDGRVDNREELTRDLKSAGAILRDDTDAELVLKAYITWGDMSPRKLSGDFAYLIWDQVSRSLYTARDVFGLRTLYYAPVGESVLLPPKSRHLFANPSVTRAPNEEALARFFSGLCSVDPTETFFKSILAFPPAACGRAVARSVTELQLLECGGSA